MCLGGAALCLATAMPAYAAPNASPAEAPQAKQSAASVCTGTVVDENGEPLFGATVRIAGTKTAGMADADGKFSLNGVQKGAKVTVNFVGYEPVTVVWTGAPLQIQMKSADSVLNEVVVMGYGVEQKRAKVTNSIAKVSEKTLTVGANANPAQALAGAVSGVKVNITTGDPGATPSIVIRGGTDWSGNNAPLVVVDGQIRGSLSDINPNDIESMEILKDAGATALYGARAANGVILITSKKGKDGNGKVSFNVKYGVNHYSSGYDYADAETYIRYYRMSSFLYANPNPAAENTKYDPAKYKYGNQFFAPYAFPAAYTALTGTASGYGTGRTVLDNTQDFNVLLKTKDNAYLLQKGWREMADPLNQYLRDGETPQTILYRSTDIMGYNMRQNSRTEEYNVNFSGGNDRGNYYASMGYYNADGALPTTFYTRYNFSFTGGYKIMDWLRANSIFNYNRANWKSTAGAGTNGAVANDYVFSRFASAPPTSRINDEDGNAIYGYQGMNLHFQPEQYVRNNQSDKFQMNQSLTATLIDGLTVKGTMNWFYSESVGDAFNKDLITNNVGSLNKTRSSSASFSRSFEQTYNVVANFNRTFNDAHTVNAMAGAEMLLRDYRDLSAWGSEAPTGDFSNLQYCFTGTQSPYKASSLGASTNYYKDALISYFGRAEYDYMDKYLVAGTLRGDGYSRLINNRWGWFPGVSAGWVFSKENFWANNENLSFMNYGKLRASFGMNGIVNSGVIGYYTLQGAYSAFSYGGVTGFRISALPNPDLRWERTRTAEVGLDLGFWQNRLNLGLTYYNRLTIDKYADKALAPTTGFSTVKSNNGKFQNQGVEIDLNGTIYQDRDWKVTAGANLTYNKNLVIELPDNGVKNNRQGGLQIYSGKGDELVYVGGLQEGQEPSHMYGFKKDHMLRTWKDVEDLGDYIDISNNVGTKKLYATDAGLERLKKLGMASGAIKLCPGDLVWKDVNGDNMIDDYDKFDLGNTIPHWTGGFNTTVSWKGFSLYARTDFGMGFTVYDGAYSWSMGSGQGAWGMMMDITKTWMPDNPNAELPRYLPGSQLGSNNYLRTSDLIACTGAYIALRELQLSYQVPTNICKMFRSQGLSLSVTGQNLGYLKKTTSPLPDNMPYSNGSTGGYGGTYPLPVSLIFGLNVSF